MSDTINDLPDNNDWNINLLRLDFQNNIMAQKTLSRDIAFTKEQKLVVNLPVEDNGKCDVYINDFITCSADINDNTKINIVAPYIENNYRYRCLHVCEQKMCFMV